MRSAVNPVYQNYFPRLVGSGMVKTGHTDYEWQQQVFMRTKAHNVPLIVQPFFTRLGTNDAVNVEPQKSGGINEK